MVRGEQADRTNVERALQQEELLEGSARSLRRRSLGAMAEFAAGLRPWDLFATFTYDQKEFEAVPSLRFAERDLGRYLGEAGQWVKRPVLGLLAVETHRSGFPHAHGLLQVGGLRSGWEISALSECWRSLRWRGFLRLERPRSLEDTAGYCAKYFLGSVRKPEAPLVASDGLLPVRAVDLVGPVPAGWRPRMRRRWR